jgi:histidinol-phosphate aminotransferase
MKPNRIATEHESKAPAPREAVARLKPYVPGIPAWEVQREYGLQRVVKLASNENPLGPSPKAVTAMQEALPELHRYPDADFRELQDALAGKLGFGPGQIIVGNGADEVIKLLAEAFVDAGDEVIVPSPTFTEYEFTGLLMGANVVSVPLGEGYSYDVEAILQAVTPKTKLVYVCTPNNPTGTYLSRTQLGELTARLPARTLLVVDAAYAHFADAADYGDGFELLRHGRRLAVLQTFSKVYGLAGIRVGYAFSTRDVIEAMLRVKEPFNVNTLAQKAALAALADEEHVAQTQALVTAERGRLYRELDRLGLAYTESMSNFVLVRLGPEAKAIYEALLRRGVILRYAGAWGLPDCVRVSIGTSEENGILLRHLAELIGR